MRLGPLVLLVLQAALGACALASGPEPRRDEATGPVVVLAHGVHDGRAWRYIAYRTADGLCEEIEFVDTGGSSGGCGSSSVELEPGTASLGVTGGSDQPTFVTGQAGIEVATVRITTRFDGDFEAATFDAPPELGLPGRFFIAALPEQSTVVSAMTLDASGEVLERIDMGLTP
jgi:hypothetical protein